MQQRLREGLQEELAVVDGKLPQAAVLVALDDTDTEPSVVLVRRATHLRLHAGEVAFPGGMCDEGDKGHWDTALREAEEEVELPRDAIQRLGYMTPLVTRTGIQVTPCVGLLQRAAELRPNPEELDSVFRAPVEYFAAREQLSFDRFDYGGRERRVPRYEYGEYSIWGITAAILVRLVNAACNAGIEMEDYWRGVPGAGGNRESKGS